MALWQFTIQLLPRQWLDAGGDVASLFGPDGYDGSSAWAKYSNPLLEQRIGELLPAAKSWCDELTCWGSDKTEDISLWREQNNVQSVTVRFDMRCLNMALFNSVVAIARELELSILVPRVRRVVASDPKVLLQVAAESDAARFALDPHSFLLQLGADIEKET